MLSQIKVVILEKDHFLVDLKDPKAIFKILSSTISHEHLY